MDPRGYWGRLGPHGRLLAVAAVLGPVLSPVAVLIAEALQVPLFTFLIPFSLPGAAVAVVGVDLLRRGRRSAGILAASVILAVALGLLHDAVSPLPEETLTVRAFLTDFFFRGVLILPVGLLVAMEAPTRWVRAGAGLVALVAALHLALIWGVEPSLASFAHSFGTYALVILVVHASASGHRLPEPADWTRRGPIHITGWVVAGATLAALSWSRTGWTALANLLWLVPIGVLALPPFRHIRARQAAVALAVLVAVLVIGAAPVGPCETDGWGSGAVPRAPGIPPPPPETVEVPLGELAGRGPWWSEGFGFDRFTVRCPAPLVGAAVGWLVAVAIAAAWVEGRAARSPPEP